MADRNTYKPLNQGDGWLPKGTYMRDPGPREKGATWMIHGSCTSTGFFNQTDFGKLGCVPLTLGSCMFLLSCPSMYDDGSCSLTS